MGLVLANVCVGDIHDFSFASIRQKFAEAAPATWGIFTSLFTDGNPTKKEKKKDDGDGLGEGENQSDDEDDDEEGIPGDNGVVDVIEAVRNAETRKRKRKVADKELVTTMAFAVACNAFSSSSNLLQGILGYFLAASGAGRRVMAVLNR